MVTAVAPAASAGLSPMQSELLSRADSIFASIGSAVSRASDLAIQGGKAVAEQIPDIAYQYVAFGRASATISIVLSLIFLMLGCVLAIKYGFKNAQNAPDDRDACDWSWGWSRVWALFVGLSLSIISLITFLNSIGNFLMVWFAPKVWLLLEIADLVKRMHS